MDKSNYLEILAGHVFDNDKLITYKWLSNELHVHVDIAKQIMWEFYQKYKNDNIECTYLLIGLVKDNEMRVEVARESAVSKAKEKFSKIISEHIYSVHKPIADLELLGTASSGAGCDSYMGAIKFNCQIRSDEEMEKLRWGTAATKKIENKEQKNSSVQVAKENLVQRVKHNTIVKSVTERKEIVIGIDSDSEIEISEPVKSSESSPKARIGTYEIASSFEPQNVEKKVLMPLLINKNVNNKYIVRNKEQERRNKRKKEEEDKQREKMRKQHHLITHFFKKS